MKKSYRKEFEENEIKNYLKRKGYNLSTLRKIIKTSNLGISLDRFNKYALDCNYAYKTNIDFENIISSIANSISNMDNGYSKDYFQNNKIDILSLENYVNNLYNYRYINVFRKEIDKLINSVI